VELLDDSGSSLLEDLMTSAGCSGTWLVRDRLGDL